MRDVSGLTVQPCGELRFSSAGFLKFSLFEFVVCNKLSCSVPDSMPVVSATFPAGEVIGSIPAQ
jgi:hypothetical protein